MAERKLGVPCCLLSQKMLFLIPVSDLSLKFHYRKYLEEILAQNFILCMFSLDAAPPQVLVRAKDKKNHVCTDMKWSWNSGLDLLVYSKCPIK